MSDHSTRGTRTNENSLSRSIVWTAWTLLTHTIAAGVLFVALIRVVPGFLVLFEEFDAALPAMTILVANLSRMVAGYWYLFVVFGFGLDAFLILGFSLLPGKAKWLGGLWASVVLLAVTLLLGFIMMAVLLPLEALITQLT